MVAESLVAYGIKSPGDAVSLVERARMHAGLGEDRALNLAVSETREHRKP